MTLVVMDAELVAVKRLAAFRIDLTVIVAVGNVTVRYVIASSGSGQCDCKVCIS